MSDHERWTTQLSAYLDRELAPARVTELEEHLDGCAACRALLDDLRAISAAAPHYVGSAPSADLWPGIAGAIEQRREVRFPGALAPPAPRVPRRYTGGQLLAASLATLVIGLGGAWFLFGRGDDLPLTAGGQDPAPVETRLVRLTADEAYAMAVTDLERVLEEGRSRLDSGTVRVIEENLRVIDHAIEEAEAAIRADPASGDLRSWIAANMRRKLDLLRRASAAVSQRATES